MRKNRYIFFTMVYFIIPVLVLGQESVLRIHPYNKTQKFLNDVILADTMANGTKPANRVYELQRGGLYLVNAQIPNAGWPFIMRANDSVGQKPVIMLYPSASTGAPPGSMVDVKENLNFRSLEITGYYEPIDTNIRNLQGQLIGTSVAGKYITIDSCILSNTNGNHIRTNSAPKNIKITNTIFANMGYLGKSNLGAGKGIDARAGSVDTLLIQNCTFVNWFDRPVRHFSSTLPIGVFIFDHNTLVNGTSYHGMLSLGKVGATCKITNNLLLDPFALGNDTDATRQAEFTDSREKDPYGGARMTWVITDGLYSDTSGTKYTISNNYYGVSDSGQAFYNRYKSAGVTGEGSPLTWYINKKLGADSVNAFKKIKITMKKIPMLMTKFMDWYRDPNGGNKTKNTPGPTYNDNFDFDRKGFVYLRDTLNCSFNASEVPVSTDGKTVGDVRWSYSGSTGVETSESQIPGKFSLEQNYPNPFNPSTVITYNIPVSGMTTLKVYNIVGQEVATLVNGTVAAGSYDAAFNASNLSSGVYFYSLRSGNFVETKKMMLMK